jgi:hypothetical protein
MEILLPIAIEPGISALEPLSEHWERKGYTDIQVLAGSHTACGHDQTMLIFGTPPPDDFEDPDDWDDDGG